MALGFLAAALKPLVVLWAGLNAVDDLALLMRASRLIPVLLPHGRSGSGPRTDLCDVCDDVMGDLLKSEGLSAVPCGLACLKLPACVKMCERVQESAATSTKFPCVAAGYCDAGDEEFIDEPDPESCDVGPFFRCEPRRFCRRRRKGLKFTCELRPGIGRWVGLKQSASEYTVAVAEGLLNQKNCGEEGAGPYCVARPTGWGKVAEMVGHVLSLVYGGYRSVAAIETPGGDDDQQWLTFWVILTAVLFVEQYFARTLLSTVPFYYEAKLVVLVWLLYRGGAETIYRRLRRVLLRLRLLKSPEEEATEELAVLKALGKGLLDDRIVQMRTESKNFMIDRNTSGEWREERWEGPGEMEQLYLASKFIMSAEGSNAMKRFGLAIDDRADLLERAAAVVSFQPRFVLARVYGTWNKPKGELPSMDRNGRADAYVTCRLVPHTVAQTPYPKNGVPPPKPDPPYPKKGIKSKIAYGTTRPQWRDTLELPLRGGIVGPDGNYRNNSARTTSVRFTVRDADIGLWGYALRFFRLSIVALVVATVVAYVKGVTNTLSQRTTEATAAAVFVGTGFVVSYFMAVVRRADDEMIGECTVPLEMLLDQSERTLLLTLKKPAAAAATVRSKEAEPGTPSSTAEEEVGGAPTKEEKSVGTKKEEDPVKAVKEENGKSRTKSMKKETAHKTNAAGGLGVLRVKVWLSEN